MDARAAALLREGAARSATFREIAQRLENSDLVIYIKVGRLDHRGKVQLVAAAPSYRILCVTIQLPGLADAIPFLAHEPPHDPVSRRVSPLAFPVRGCVRRDWSVTGRMSCTMVVLASVALPAAFRHWHLLRR